MEEAAGFTDHDKKIMVPWHFCDLCLIGIGPEHIHQSIYLYPAYHEQAGPKGERKHIIGADMFCVCESCASWRERDLPEWLCVIGPWAWETNALIKSENEELASVPQSDGELRADLRARAIDHVEACGWYIIYLMSIAFNIPLQYLLFCIPLILEEEEARQPLPLTAKKISKLMPIPDPGIVFRRA
jgi:hypothetical protein